MESSLWSPTWAMFSREVIVSPLVRRLSILISRLLPFTIRLSYLDIFADVGGKSTHL